MGSDKELVDFSSLDSSPLADPRVVAG